MDEVQARLDRLINWRWPIHASRRTRTDAADRALMARAWRRSLTALRQSAAPGQGAASAAGGAPGRGQRRRLGSRRAGADVAASLGKLYDVELVTFADAGTFDWNALPGMAASPCWPRPRACATARMRAPAGARTCTWPCGTLPGARLRGAGPDDLRLCPPALDAVNAWLSGALEAAGNAPVPGFA
jgi:beta-N-acetylhexosaminidase